VPVPVPDERVTCTGKRRNPGPATLPIQTVLNLVVLGKRGLGEGANGRWAKAVAYTVMMIPEEWEGISVGGGKGVGWK
jgi:hypothetical protein